MEKHVIVWMLQIIYLLNFASLEYNTYIHKIIRQGDHYSLANYSGSLVDKN